MISTSWRLLGLSALVAIGCVRPPPAVNAALHEDLAALQREIARAEQAGELDRKELTRLAHAVAAREIASAKGESGAGRVRAFRSCARPLLDRLRIRADGSDEVAAEAMLVRLTQNDVESARLVAEYEESVSPAWRAVAARAALAQSDVLLRRRWYADPDERVRRAALEAALFAPDASDVELLLEASRLDPDPLSRSFAARAVGAIGGERAVYGLVDRFARAEEALRLAIVDALAMPAAFASGGARELRSIADAEQGVVSISAVSALLRNGETDGALVGVLVSALDHGSAEERRLAVGLLPTKDPSVRAALARAARTDEPELQVRALGRLLLLEDVPTKKEDAARLRKLAQRADTAGAEARVLLAKMNDRSVVSALTRDVTHGDSVRRGSAALALFRLGETGKAARALGDVDPNVRVAVSCAVLREGS